MFHVTIGIRKARYRYPRRISVWRSVRHYKDVVICRPGTQEMAAADLRMIYGPGGIHTSNSIPKEEHKRRLEKAAWPVQVLPDAHFVTSNTSSLQKLGVAVAHSIASQLKPILSENPNARWTIHALESPGCSWQGKCKQLVPHVMAEMSKTAKPLLRNARRGANAQDGDYLVQVFMRAESSAAVSISQTSFNGLCWNRPVPFLSGIVHIDNDDEKYPASSYAKLKEIFAHMKINLNGGLQGKACIELGAAPGGWTSVLLEAGASRVYSVDLAPLVDQRLTSHPNLIHTQCDAFQFRPPEEVKGPVDYLLTDMAMPPTTSLQLLEEWVKNKWCKVFAWTLKFGFHHDPSLRKKPPEQSKKTDELKKTAISYAATLDSAHKMLKQYPFCRYYIRHLYKHGNEVVILGICES